MQPWNEDAFVSKFSTTGESVNNSCTSEYIYESNEIRVTRLTAEVFLALAGAVFNISICLMNLKHSSINTAIQVYIRNMAFADIGILLLGFPFAVAKEQESTREWIVGSIACRYLYPITDIFYTVSIWSMVAIAVERCRIMKTSQTWHGRPSRALRVVLVLWVTAFIIICLPILLASKYGSFCDKKHCYIRWPSASKTNTVPPKVHSFALLFILFIAPVGVMVWSYCKVSVSYKQAACRVETSSLPRHRRLQSDNSDNTNPSVFSDQDEARQQECEETRRFLTPLIILFVISTIPMNILRAIFIFRSTMTSLEQYLVLFNLAIMLSICNSVLRPFIYYIVNGDIREGCKILVAKVKKGIRRSWGEHHDEMMPLQENIQAVSMRHSKTDYKETIL